jgi:hypothetical protein
MDGQTTINLCALAGAAIGTLGGVAGIVFAPQYATAISALVGPFVTACFAVMSGAVKIAPKPPTDPKQPGA